MTCWHNDISGPTTKGIWKEPIAPGAGRPHVSSHSSLKVRKSQDMGKYLVKSVGRHAHGSSAWREGERPPRETGHACTPSSRNPRVKHAEVQRLRLA